MKQNGGLKLINPQKYIGKIGFTPIMDMINNRSSALDVLTYKSLKGFMITLDISPEETEYFGLDKYYKFTKPITSFILKFAVITEDNDEELPIYKGIKKHSESKDSYHDEAKLQQNIWKKSIIGGRREICPPVANFSLFDNNNSSELCCIFKSKSRKTPNVNSIFNYLLDCISVNQSYGIGVIVMPNIEKSDTFGKFLNYPDGYDFYGIEINPETRNLAYASVSAQIARLFIDIGVIHYDLHSGNILIFVTPDNNISSLIIDFGRASNIFNSINDDYLTLGEKRSFNSKRGNYYNKLFFPHQSDEFKKTFLIEVLDFISATDHKKNQEIFQFTDPKRYQMRWYDSYPKDTDVPLKAFDILKASITSNEKMLPQTIRDYENQGFIFNLDLYVNTFYVTLPTSTGMCSIMGGRPKNIKCKKFGCKRIKQTIRSKKLRKSKKNKTVKSRKMK